MCSQIWKLLREHLALSLKCGSVLFLFLVSILVVACGANNSTQASGAPPVTVTINLNQTFASPPPKLAPYSCGAWVTFATPGYSPNAVVPVYAKFVQIVNGNPQGMNSAAAQATVQWPDGRSQQINATTTSDGLAIFQVAMDASALNHVVLISVTFTSSDGQHRCTTPQPAYFTAVQASPTAKPSASPPIGASPSVSPNPFPFPTRTAIPTTPTPKGP